MRSASPRRRHRRQSTIPISCWCRWRRSTGVATGWAMAAASTTPRSPGCAPAVTGANAVAAVGWAFAAQEVAAVPAEPHDARLDWIVTEREAIYIPG